MIITSIGVGEVWIIRRCRRATGAWNVPTHNFDFNSKSHVYYCFVSFYLWCELIVIIDSFYLATTSIITSRSLLLSINVNHLLDAVNSLPPSICLHPPINYCCLSMLVHFAAFHHPSWPHACHITSIDEHNQRTRTLADSIHGCKWPIVLVALSYGNELLSYISHRYAWKAKFPQ